LFGKLDMYALNEAHELAVKHLPSIKSVFVAGLKPGERLYVRHAFEVDPFQQEHLWLRVTGWIGDRLSGVLVDQPQQLTDLACGDEVFLWDDQIYDWLFTRADGSCEGGYTEEVAIEAQERFDRTHEDYPVLDRA
ncbi:MAG: DUF2314 domain-containing protein, partial [Candidatus Eremiobacterota bacterium]